MRDRQLENRETRNDRAVGSAPDVARFKPVSEAASVETPTPRAERIRILARGLSAGDPVFEVSPSQLSEHLNDGHPLIWIDVHDPREDASAVFRECLEVSPLTLEDLLQPLRMPKVDRLDDGAIFIAAFGASLDHRDGPRLRPIEMDVLARPGLLVTAHDGSLPTLEPRLQAELESLTTDRGDAAFLLAHAALDAITDGHLPELIRSAEAADELEDSLDPRYETASLRALDRLIVLRRDLLSFRRVAVGQHEALRRLERLAPGMAAHFSDVRDNEREAIDLADATCEYIDGAIEAYRLRRDERIGGGIRRLTILAALFGPLSLLAGIFGANFNEMPGTDSQWGFYIFVLVELVLAAASIVILRRRRLL
jgi:magnesium transporter